MRSSRIAPLFALALLVPVAGCGDGNPKTYSIPGRLVYEDGKPVPGASVVFQTTVDGKVVSARGMAGPDGRFELTTFKEKDGVVAGEHRVAVSPVPVPDDQKPAVPAVPPPYGDFATSGLKATVAPDTSELVVTIARKK